VYTYGSYRKIKTGVPPLGPICSTLKRRRIREKENWK